MLNQFTDSFTVATAAQIALKMKTFILRRRQRPSNRRKRPIPRTTIRAKNQMMRMEKRRAMVMIVTRVAPKESTGS